MNKDRLKLAQDESQARGLFSFPGWEPVLLYFTRSLTLIPRYVLKYVGRRCGLW